MPGQQAPGQTVAVSFIPNVRESFDDGSAAPKSEARYPAVTRSTRMCSARSMPRRRTRDWNLGAKPVFAAAPSALQRGKKRKSHRTCPSPLTTSRHTMLNANLGAANNGAVARTPHTQPRQPLPVTPWPRAAPALSHTLTRTGLNAPAMATYPLDLGLSTCISHAHAEPSGNLTSSGLPCRKSLKSLERCLFHSAYCAASRPAEGVAISRPQPHRGPAHAASTRRRKEGRKCRVAGARAMRCARPGCARAHLHESAEEGLRRERILHTIDPHPRATRLFLLISRFRTKFFVTHRSPPSLYVRGRGTGVVLAAHASPAPTACACLRLSRG